MIKCVSPLADLVLHLYKADLFLERIRKGEKKQSTIRYIDDVYRWTIRNSAFFT